MFDGTLVSLSEVVRMPEDPDGQVEWGGRGGLSHTVRACQSGRITVQVANLASSGTVDCSGILWLV